MEVKLRKLGENYKLEITPKVADSFGIDENSILELIESKDALVITKKNKVPTLDELLTSIPSDFEDPDDVRDFVKTEPLGGEMI